MNLKNIYPKRNSWSHKRQFGYVLIIAGSEHYSGSPAFNALAALRSGADLATIIGPKRAMDIAATFTPDIITYPLKSELSPRDVSKILKLTKDFHALVIGGGLNRSARTHQAIREIIKKTNLPLVIDAEAIRAIAGEKEILKNKQAIITPHAEEFRILTGEKVTADLTDRKTKTKKWSEKINSVILLKGHIDIISDGKKVVLNKTGSPFMTKGGCGDILAGICGALMARGIKPFPAAQAAAWINGRAGELAGREYNEGALASDLLLYIPRAIKK